MQELVNTETGEIHGNVSMEMVLADVERQVAEISTIEQGIDIETRANKLRDLYIISENVVMANRCAKACCEAGAAIGNLLGIDVKPGPQELSDASDVFSNRDTKNRYRNMARVPVESRYDYYESATEEGEIISKAGVIRLFKSAHVSHNSGENEWYTPARFVESARVVMGSIDLDPASSKLAQKTVKAAKYYTADTDGLDDKHIWTGNVWMNPPYEAGYIDKFITKMDESDVMASIVLVNNSTDTGWFETLTKKASAICFPKGRIKFIDKNGKASGAPLQGQAIVYRGQCPDDFVSEFLQYGLCVEVAHV